MSVLYDLFTCVRLALIPGRMTVSSETLCARKQVDIYSDLSGEGGWREGRCQNSSLHPFLSLIQLFVR